MKILVIGKYNPLDSTNPIILIKIGLLQTLPESYWELSFQKKTLKFPYSFSLDQLSPSILLIIILHTAYSEHLFPFHFPNCLSNFSLFRSSWLSFMVLLQDHLFFPFLMSAPLLRWDAQNQGEFPQGGKYHRLIFPSWYFKHLARGSSWLCFNAKYLWRLLDWLSG